MNTVLLLTVTAVVCLIGGAAAAFSNAQKAKLNRFVGQWAPEKLSLQSGEFHTFQFNFARLNADLAQKFLAEAKGLDQAFRQTLLSGSDGETVEVFYPLVHTKFKDQWGVNLGVLKIQNVKDAQYHQFVAPLFAERVRTTYRHGPNAFSISARLVGDALELQYLASTHYNGLNDYIFTLAFDKRGKLTVAQRKLDPETKVYSKPVTTKYIKSENFGPAPDALTTITEEELNQIEPHYRAKTLAARVTLSFSYSSGMSYNYPEYELAPWKEGTDALGAPLPQPGDGVNSGNDGGNGRDGDEKGGDGKDGKKSEKSGHRLTSRRRGTASGKGGSRRLFHRSNKDE